MIRWLFEGLGDRKNPQGRALCFFAMALFFDVFSAATLYYINSRLYARTVYYIGVVLFFFLVSVIAKSMRMHVPWGCKITAQLAWLFFLLLVMSSFVFGVSDIKLAFRALLHYVWFVIAVFYCCRGVNATRMLRFYIITYYIACVVMSLTIHSSLTTFNFAEGQFRAVDEVRMTSSIAYLIKNALYIGLYLFLVGLVKGKRLGRISRCLCLLAVIPYLYFLVVEFKFRTGAILILLALILTAGDSFRRLRFSTLALLLICMCGGFLAVFKTNVFSGFLERVEEKNTQYEVNQTGFLEGERFQEARLMLEELSPLEQCIGRGFDAQWDASSIFGEAAGTQRRGIHLGAISPVLFGGWPLSVFILFVYFYAITRRLDPRSWYFDDLRICKLFVIIMFVRNLANPLPFAAPEYADLPQYLSLGMLWMVENGRIRWLDLKGPYA